ncbi:hypothetical protein K8O68_04465 [Salipaludibacillus sp. CUR1]|uniref:penicillin-binding transpeptidase domain-containing protein n=1 Tax=Salipaludibacillus sp. CUR1 TaxID=2820003 RepID=UPI001E37E7A8|nr:penicillin-binding transpeptidase domain-containing protein [Salipaludibacillus sp. CUR1]MCE7791682.1 hypothetical protein [Salipaludibacillus sp. CUR1]
MRHTTLFISLSALLLAGMTACTGEEPENPEETLEGYTEAWSEKAFSEMPDYLTENSRAEVAGFEWDFEERYDAIYGELGIDTINISFESVDFEEEEIDLDELEEIDYPVSVEMDTAAGLLSYDTAIALTKFIPGNEEEENEAEWGIEWDPSHFIKGMEEPEDTVSIETEQPARGGIFDRNGESLAVNGDIYEVGIVPERTEDMEETIEQFAEVLNLDEERVADLATRYPDNPDWNAPIQNLSIDDDRLEDLLEIPGVGAGKVEGRVYPHGESTGHLIGHIGAITAEELEEREGEGYGSTSEIGKNGIERLMEEELRGSPGMTVSINREDGELRETILETEPENGEDLYLTLDISIQDKMYGVLNNDSGAGFVMDPKTGETLAMVSVPTFNSNLRYLQLPDPRAEDMESTDILFERRFQGAYSPGSVFKPLTAAAGLEEGTLDPEEELVIEGKQWQPDDSWGGYRITRVNDEETNVDLQTAMMRSDNIYFARQTLDMGQESFEEWAGKFGFGEPFPYDFPLYSSTLANEDIENEILLADSGYGQGEVQVTPVHMTALYTMFLNDGNLIYPFLFSDGLQSENEGEMEELISPENAEIVRESLISVVEDSDGTAYRSDAGHNRALAGKTGTAELKEEQTAEDGEQIGWYVSFDYEEEDYLTTIMVQNVEERGGSSYVVDLANEFWEKVEE